MLRTLVFLLFFCLNANAQNLVMNPSFEEHYSCDFGTSNIWECKGVFNPVTNPSTSDYFNVCMPEASGAKVPYPFGGYQMAKSGNAYLGIFITASNFQEYAQIKLNQSLVGGLDYDFSFSVNLSNLSRYSSDDIHVKFVSDSIVYSEALHEFMVPDWKNDEGNYITDTVGWTKLSGTYTAIGTERWMIIGCFYGVNDATVQTTYSENNQSAYYFIDEVVLKKDSLIIPNVFTPNNDGINDYWSVDANVSAISIYDRWGQRVYCSNVDFNGWDGNRRNGIPCSSGVYYYLVTTININGAEETHRGFLTLLR